MPSSGEPPGPRPPLFGLPAVSISCPRCGRLVDAGAASCPRCGYSLQPDAPAGARPPAGAAPTEVLHADRARTAPLPVTPAAPAAAPAPATGPGRGAGGGLPMPVVPPPRTSGRRSPVLLVAVGLVVTSALWLLLSAVIDRSTPPSANLGPAAPGGSPSAAGGPRQVKNSAVDGVASSTAKAEGDTTYGIQNTLDDRPSTAWNSRGKGIGATLTYTFEQPVALRGITVRNGYQKLVTSIGNPDRDLYELNERVRQMRVTTASGAVVWNLKDAREPQTLTRDLGTTRTVTLTILSTYGSTQYKDVGLSEIVFTEAG